MRVLLLVDDLLLQGILCRHLFALPGGIHVSGEAGILLRPEQDVSQAVQNVLMPCEPALVIVDDRLDGAILGPELHISKLISELRRSAPQMRIPMQIWVLYSYGKWPHIGSEFTAAGADRLLDKGYVTLEEIGRMVTDHRDSIVHSRLPVSA